MQLKIELQGQLQNTFFFIVKFGINETKECVSIAI
jgi:hypothetical protein